MPKYIFESRHSDTDETKIQIVEAVNIHRIANDLTVIHSETTMYELYCQYCQLFDERCVEWECPTWTGMVAIEEK